MVTDDLGNQRQPEPGALALGGDEGVEQVGLGLAGHPRSRASALDNNGRAAGAPVPGNDQRQAGRKGVAKRMRPGSRSSAIASAAFFTRLRKAWISLSRLP